MKNNTQITDIDIQKLRNMLDGSEFLQENPAILKKITEKIENAVVVPQKQVLPYLVTMNSHVSVTHLNEERQLNFWLVYHDEINKRKDRVSVFTDLGISVLGLKTGDTFEIGESNEKFRISGIYYQPEANHHYKL
ncbi:MAG: GreA/GreB family elongation factor [Phycisphaerales bacterium]